MNETNGVPLVLASGSTIRRTLLENAGLDLIVSTSKVDEDVIKVALLSDNEAMTTEDIAVVLAEAKALDVSERHPGSLVVGADQTLSFEGQLMSKSASVEAARRSLLDLKGRTHSLHSASVIVRDGEVLARQQASAHLTMRDFTPEFLGRYMARVGESALTTVGGYQLEGMGVQLFEAIDGDYFTVLGLPLLPLLADLRKLGLLED